MERRETVQEKLTFSIKGAKQYKMDFCTWGELIATEGPQPGDKLGDLHWEKHESSGFGGYDTEDDIKTYYTPSVTVVRPRPENDKEFEARMKRKAQFEKENEEKEKLEYLRLKAKFEN